MNRKKTVSLIIMVMALLAVTVAPTLAARAGFGELYYDGGVVRTVVPPAKMPKPGNDNLYVIVDDEGPIQRPVAAVAPGDRDYNGGKWAFHSVTWIDAEAAHDLTSEAAVLEAEANGLVTITRVPEMDFKCPIQP